VLGQLQSVNKQLMPVADWAHEDDKAYARQKAVVKGGGKYVEETTSVTNRRGEEEEQVVLALVAPYDEVLAVAQAELQRFEDELADSFAGGPYGLDDVELLPTLRNSTCANRKAAPLLALTYPCVCRCIRGLVWPPKTRAYVEEACAAAGVKLYTPKE